jgi:hypothetical protein
MTTLEHAVPVPVLYDDVMKLFLSSGTSYTPTHIVNYGGTMGEQFIWASHDIPDDSKCVIIHPVLISDMNGLRQAKEVHQTR